MPTAAHFLFIPGVLLVGIVIGWILGSRAAADAYAARTAPPSSTTRNPPRRFSTQQTARKTNAENSSLRMPTSAIFGDSAVL